MADLMHASDAPLDQDMIAYICAETLAGLSYLHSIGKVSFCLSSVVHATLQGILWSTLHPSALQLTLIYIYPFAYASLLQ